MRKVKTLHASIMYMRETKNTSRFDNVHEKNKIFFTFKKKITLRFNSSHQKNKNISRFDTVYRKNKK